MSSSKGSRYIESNKENKMLKTRILEGEEYWEAYRYHKCTGRPVISVGVEEVKSVQVEKPKTTKWKRRSGDGIWYEVKE